MKEDQLYEIVVEELRTGSPREGLWLKALSSAAGDKTLAQALYVKLRVEQLSEEDSKKGCLAVIYWLTGTLLSFFGIVMLAAAIGVHIEKKPALLETLTMGLLFGALPLTAGVYLLYRARQNSKTAARQTRTPTHDITQAKSDDTNTVRLILKGIIRGGRRKFAQVEEAKKSQKHLVEEKYKVEAKPEQEKANIEEARACPSCGNTRSIFGANVALNIFSCSCGKVYCDQCSGGGLIDLPRCPVSPYHENMKKIGFVQRSGISVQENIIQKQETSASPASKAETDPTERDLLAKQAIEAQITAIRSFSEKQAGYSKDAIRILFEKAMPHAPVLTHDQIIKYSRDWADGDAGLHWGSQQEIEALVLRHFQSLEQKPRFEIFRIETNDRWMCVFATTFYSGVANFLLVWREENKFAVAHT